VSAHIFEWEAGSAKLYIRDLASMEDYREVEQIQIEAWGFNELDVVPSGQLIAAKWAGAVLLGAFDAERMIGFVYGFPALEEGHVSLHSHMLAVRPGSRNLHAGIYLKLAQRIKALEQGLDEISWTFDPLQALNANLNFARLGVISERYIVNFYGEETSSPLHRGVGTDRLWVRWLISTERVNRRIALVRGQEDGESGHKDRECQQAAEHHMPTEASCQLDPNCFQPDIPADIKADTGEPGPLILARSGGSWVHTASSDLPGEFDECLIEIPADIGAVKRTNIEVAQRWRSGVQSAFLRLFSSGFVALEFVKSGSPSDPRWFYLLGHEAPKGAS